LALEGRTHEQAVDDGIITDAKTRYTAGVLKYRQMGYWVPDYQPKDTDTLACSASRRKKASTRSKPPLRWPRVEYRDLDRRVDRSPDRVRQLPRKAYKVEPVPGIPASTSPGSPMT